MNGARRQTWAAIGASHGALPAVRIADKVLQGVTCIRLDATITPACSDKALAEPNFKGLCDVMPLVASERVGEGQ